MSEWISVKDRLPEYGERVLVTNADMVHISGYTMYDVGVTVRSINLNFTFWGHPITHWMPLPEPPKENLDPWDELAQKLREIPNVE